ncbi:hypothetical protein [Calothrix sp. PCC 6303]|uniref:hypothetical protein n=1 Tax=Calothrix sp. PCC 6303 TaxID=1170562 RepID=UPI00059F01A6|nr:hypothetical protein [Calothrix sp. PCC 6303]
MITTNPISTSKFVADFQSSWESAAVVVEYLFMGTMGNILLKHQQITGISKPSFTSLQLQLPIFRIFLSYPQSQSEVRSTSIAQLPTVGLGLGNDRINNQNHGYGRISWVNPASKYSQRSGKYRERDAVPIPG